MKIRIYEWRNINNGSNDMDAKGALIFQADVEEKSEEHKEVIKKAELNPKYKYILVEEKVKTGHRIKKDLGVADNDEQ